MGKVVWECRACLYNGIKYQKFIYHLYNTGYYVVPHNGEIIMMVNAACVDCGAVKVVHDMDVRERCITCYNKHRADNALPRKLYSRWAGMVHRCTDPGNHAYHRYGGRGITVCDEWVDDARAFCKWANANGYTDGTKLSLDRIDNNAGYSPGNCRFTTKAIQSQNTCRLSSSNTSGYRGVSLDGRSGTYVAEVRANKKRVRVGRFTNARDAAVARDKYIIANGLAHTLNLTADELKIPTPQVVKPFVHQGKTDVRKMRKAPPRGACGYYGVDKETCRQGYRVGMSVNGKRVRLGTHPTPEAAALVRDKYVIKHKLFGRHLNFPELYLMTNNQR